MLAWRSLASRVVIPDVKRQIARMGGEILREAGVLVLVFAPLDALFTPGTLTPGGIVAIVVIVVPCFVIGMVAGLER